MTRQETLIAAALASLRNGRFAEGPVRYPRTFRWAKERYLTTVYEAGGSSLLDDRDSLLALRFLLVWALSQLRPDSGLDLDSIPEDAWINKTSWRPILAIACHHGFLDVPSMSSRYRRRVGEPAIENLCGLWAVGTSTFYRYLEKGRQQLTSIFLSRLFDSQSVISLRDSVARQLLNNASINDRSTWHSIEATRFSQLGKYGAALWHLWKSGHHLDAMHLAMQHPAECAAVADCEYILSQLQCSSWDVKERLNLTFARAAIFRANNNIQQEQLAYENALQISSESGDPLLIGRALSSMGEFWEARDVNRSFACYDSCIDQLHKFSQKYATNESMETDFLSIYGKVLIRVAWLHLRRGDPRAKTAIDEASRISHQVNFPLSLSGQLEQTKGELLRCNGEHTKAIEHKHKALSIFLQLDDKISIWKTYLNLSLLFGEVKEFEKAIEYAMKVLEANRSFAIGNEIMLATYGNLGVAFFWKGAYNEAIEWYRKSLEIAYDLAMLEHAGTTHMNIAEAYYKKFQLLNTHEDEVLGDFHTNKAIELAKTGNSAKLLEAGRLLKRDVLGNDGLWVDQLLPVEFLSHYPQMMEIKHLQSQLSLPVPIELQARLRIQIAKSFLSVVMEERDRAAEIIREHGLTSLESELEALLQAWTHDGNLASQLNQRWREQVGDWLTDSQRKALLERLLAEGSLSKSSYGEAAEVSPATASKHLGLLADKGLLEQQGRGPATRYVLPSGQHSGSREGTGPAGSPGTVH